MKHEPALVTNDDCKSFLSSACKKSLTLLHNSQRTKHKLKADKKTTRLQIRQKTKHALEANKRPNTCWYCIADKDQTHDGNKQRPNTFFVKDFLKNVDSRQGANQTRLHCFQKAQIIVDSRPNPNTSS